MGGPSRLSPGERSLRASLAANARWAKTSRADASGQARKGQQRRFEAGVDPEGVLSPVERAARADNARRAHMRRMALRSAQVRRRRRAAADVRRGVAS